MPEWTVQKVRYLSSTSSGGPAYKGRHCVECDKELWHDFELDSKYVVARLNSILDLNGRIIATIGENILLECQHLYIERMIMSDYATSTASEYYYLLIFPRDFVKQYGLRTGECADLVLLGISNYSNKIEMKEEIYPKRFITGRIDVSPAGISVPQSTGITEPLIQQSLEGDFYKDLIQEINLSHAYQLYRSTFILIRKLFENLLIDVLRTKFGMQRLDLFYNENRRQFLDFYYLVDSLKNEKEQFAPITSGFDQKFFDFLSTLREDGNANAHALEAFPDKDALDKNKEKLNHYIKVIKNSIEIMKKSN